MGYINKGSCDGVKSIKCKLVTCLIFGVLLLAAGVLSVIVNPLKILSTYMSRMDNGTAMQIALTKETDSIHLACYLFNVTNADRFASGEDEKLKIQEVGPFTYQENRTNEAMEIDSEAGVARYTPKYKVTFLPEESIGDPKEVVLTLPNIAMLALGSRASTYGYFARVGYNVMVSRLNSNATVTLNVHDYLWGYDEPMIKLGYQFMPGWIDFEKLGLLDRLYSERETKRIEVSIRDEDRFMIKSADSIGGLSMWGYEDPETRSRCNSFTDAYEGLCYPPELTSDRPIRLYRSILCRLLEFDYQETVTRDMGIEALLYKMSNRTFRNIPDNKCFCSQGICYDGVSDMSPCVYDLPLVLSRSHFIDTDPNVYSKIEGLTPNEKEHGSELLIETAIGMVLQTKFSVQINVFMRDVRFNSKISKFSDMLVPVGYFKVIQPKMAEDLATSLREIHIYYYYAQLAIQVGFITAGLLLLSYSTRIFYRNWIYANRKEIHFQTKDCIIDENNKLLTSK